MGRNNTAESPYVKCPYYRCQRLCVVYCEGTEPESRIHMAFATDRQRQDYQRRFCQGSWQSCLIAGGHNRRYEER